MKKTLKIVLLLSIASILGYWGYTWYNNKASLLGVIHKDADSAIKIAFHDIKETLILDAVTSPIYYYDNASFKPRKTDKDTIDKKGVDLMPYNLILFTVPTVENTYFSVLKIKNTKAFKHQIDHYVNSKGLILRTDDQNNVHWLENKKQRWVCAWNTEKVIVSFGLDNSYAKSKNIFFDILKSNKVIESKGNDWITSLSESKSHITYLNRKSKITLQFVDGEAVIKGNIITDGIRTYPKEVDYARIPEASINFYWDANFKHPKNKQRFIKSWEGSSFLKKMNLDLSQAVDLTNGFVYLGVKGTTSQSDTIVTYTYDDNFNKIEEKTYQEKKVPNMVLYLEKEKNGLKDYLAQKDLLNQNGVFTGFPLYRFYVVENTNSTLFETGKSKLPLEQATDQHFMNLSIDFAKAKEDFQIPQLEGYFDLLQALELSAKQAVGNEIALEGKIKGKKQDINFLSQLFFGLDQD